MVKFKEMVRPIESRGVRIPIITTDAMREVDRLMVENYNVQLIQMMENAGRNLAELSRTFLGGAVMGKSIAVAAGGGNNGGGGLAAARHLYNWGARITLLLRSLDLTGAPDAQIKTLAKLPVTMREGERALSYLSTHRPDLILDAIIGYGISGAPRGWAKGMVQTINESNIPVISLDVPTGLDAATGEVHEPCIEAKATMTLALPKRGLFSLDAKKVVGHLYLADIGVPHVLYKEMGIDVGPIFKGETIIKIEEDN